MRRAFGLAAVAALVLCSVVTAAYGRGRGLQHVTLIGDSVASAVGKHVGRRGGQPGRRPRRRGDACRRLEDPSCPPGPPTVIDLIKQLGPQIGPTVVIAVGYNDFADHYAAEIDDVLAALEAANVQHIFWLTLRPPTTRTSA